MALIASGQFSPCHSARWNSGGGTPSAAALATRTSGSAMKGINPTAMHTATSSITGAFMPSGGRAGMLGRSFGGPLKKVSCTRRIE